MKKWLPWILAGVLLALGLTTVLMWDGVMMVYRERQLADENLDWINRDRLALDLISRYERFGAPIERAVEHLGTPYLVAVRRRPTEYEVLKDIPEEREEFLSWFHRKQKEHERLIVLWSDDTLTVGADFRNGIAVPPTED